MKPVVYAISDLHGNLPDFPKDGEVFLIAGDICPDFRPRGWRNQGHAVDTGGAQQAGWLGTMFRDWLESRPTDSDVYAIWGNHDFVGEKPFLVPDLPWTLINDKTAYSTVGVTRDVNLTIHGSPWVPGLPYWAFYGTDEFLKRRMEHMPHGLDILLSHGPPHGAGDVIPGGSEKQVKKYGNLHGRRVGDPWLRELTLDRRTAPKIIVCGHIHESRGVHVSGASDVYNVAAVNDDYQLHDNPWARIHI